MNDDKALSAVSPAWTFPPVHPIGFALWPALALYGRNVERIPLAIVAVPLLLYAGIGVVLPMVFRTFAGSWAKASLMASVAIIALCDIWKPIAIDVLLYHSVLDPWVFYSLYGFFIVLALAFIHATPASLQGSTPVLNLVAAVMIAWPAFQISKEMLRRPPSPKHETISPDDLPGNMANTTNKPNVVLLILDEYSRADILDKHFGFDNQDFIQALEERGFMVGRESMSNYPTTKLSVTSALNMDYLSNLADDTGEVNHRELMKNNYVLRLFDSMNYETYAFTTGFPVTEPGPLVDHVLSDKSSLVTMTGFLGLLLELSPANEITEALGIDFTHRIWRDNILHTLNNLHRPIAEGGERPVYVRAHILAPHPPFIFDADGGPRRPKGSFTFRRSEGPLRKKQLVDQTMGLNKHVLQAVDEVLAASTDPPIILITSDHATHLSYAILGRNLEILLAAYLPGKGQDVPREEIDSMHLVNLFRLVFNTYFDTEFPMLKYEAPKDEILAENAPTEDLEET